MQDQFFKLLSRGAKFSKDQALSLKRDHEQTHQEEDEEISVDFFAPKPKNTADPSKDVLVKTGKKKKPSFKSTEDVNLYRKKKQIKVYGSDVANPVKNFDMMLKLGVPESVLVSVKAAGFKWPTAVQQQAVPMLSQNRDAFVVAPTGSGKTLAFLLGTLAKLSKTPEEGKIRAIIISPTRELAQQIATEMKRFVPGTSYKAAFLNKALLNQWKNDPPTRFHDILVTNPLRLIYAVENKIIDLSSVQSIILDEADKLFELGFLNQLDSILEACTCPSLQKCLFSATIPTGVEEAARSFMLDPIKLVIGAPNSAAASIQQKLLYVGQEDGKLLAIRQMLLAGGEDGLTPPVIIFTETIDRAQALMNELRPLGIKIDAIHSEKSQAERESIIKDFRTGKLWFLVTTELLARGLDFPDVNCVINYDFPTTTASYIHRIGRTARAGKEGRAVTLFTKDDADSLRMIVNVMRQSGCEVPEWMLELKPKMRKKAVAKREMSKKKLQSANLDDSE